MMKTLASRRRRLARKMRRLLRHLRTSSHAPPALEGPIVGDGARERIFEIAARPTKSGVTLVTLRPRIGPECAFRMRDDGRLVGAVRYGDDLVAPRGPDTIELGRLLGIGGGHGHASGGDGPSETTIDVVVPAGKLGVLVNDHPGTGAAHVAAVGEGSALHGRMLPGDRIMAVDGEDVSGLGALHTSVLLGSKSRNSRRRITVARDLCDGELV